MKNSPLFVANLLRKLVFSLPFLLSIEVVEASVVWSAPFGEPRWVPHAPRLTETHPCDERCNATWCRNCVVDQCQTLNETCFIEGACYELGYLYMDRNDSCLECQSTDDTEHWSFNEDCSAGVSCFIESFMARHVCSQNITVEFYKSHDNAVVNLYDFDGCRGKSEGCQAGFFFSEAQQRHVACCPGYFCPEGQVCMIPCRPGSYCPSPLKAIDGACQNPTTCPQYPSKDYGKYGCGGSTFEGFCPNGTFCERPDKIQPCGNGTRCPTGVQDKQPCPQYFYCEEGRARRGRLLVHVPAAVAAIIVGFVGIVELFQWLAIKKNLFGKQTLDQTRVSDYFQKRPPSAPPITFQLNIHLRQARLRNVTRFDLERNKGFTGRIAAGRLTALMGGSGCGKSSLLESIHGRRRLQPGGFIKFAEHEPLSNALTGYIGFVPQADIMHEDLTVFETVYYSARARRLGESLNVIKNDVCFVLEKLKLDHMHNNVTRTLSGGQRKRVNVAMEIAACPKVLLLDEPTSGLDTCSCDLLFELLQLVKYSAAGPVTIIMVVHQPSQELFNKIDDVFFLTPTCCLAYQGPREKAQQHLRNSIYSKTPPPPSRHNDCDTCFIMLSESPKFVDNHNVQDEIVQQVLTTHSWKVRCFWPFLFVVLRSLKQIYLRGIIAEAAYMLSYFVLGTCVGYLFENEQLSSCDIQQLTPFYFLISLSFGVLTCISSQRLFGVEITNLTFERESRTYFHPIQYWLAKSLIDVLRLVFYPLLYLSMVYILFVPRGSFSYYLGVMVLLSFVCSGIGQLTSVIFRRTEYAYLTGTIVALLSCLLSGFSPTKAELGRGSFIVTLSFSRHAQRMLFLHETEHYVKVLNGNSSSHVWSTQVKAIEANFSYDDSENPRFWLVFIGLVLRAITILCLYGKSEYRSFARFHVSHPVLAIKSLLERASGRTKT